MKFRLLGQTQHELKQKNNVHQTYSKNVTFKKELHKIKKKKRTKLSMLNLGDI